MNSSIGLYLGTGSVDLVQLTGSFRHPQVVSWGRVALPMTTPWRGQPRAEDVSSGGSVSEEAMVRAIQTLLSRGGLATNRVHVAVASESVVIRYFQMPAIPVHERKAAISFEAKKYLPFKLEEMITDFEVVMNRSDPTLMRVMFFGIKRNSIQSIMSCLKSVDLDAVCIEPSPMSLTRLLRQSSQLPPGQVAAMLFLERDTATISIARGDLLYLSRNVSTLGPSDSAQKQPAGEEAPSAELLDALMNETRVSIDYYRRRFLGEPSVSKVILFGREVDRKRIGELSSALDLPVEAGDPFQQIVAGKEVSANLAVATGLALRGLEKQEGQTNLLPPERRRNLEGLAKPVILELVSLLLLLGLAYGLALWDLHGLRQSIGNLKRTEARATMVKPGASLSDLHLALETQSKRSQFLEKLSQGRNRRTRLLAALAPLVPAEAWLQYAYLDETLKSEPSDPFPKDQKRILQLRGGAFLDNRDKELERINQFISTLRSDPAFKESFSEFRVDALQRGSYQEEEMTEFQLTCGSSPEDLQRGPEAFSGRGGQR